MKYYECYYWEWKKYPDYTRIINEEVYNDMWWGNKDLYKWKKINNWDSRNFLFFEKEWTNRDYLSNSIIQPTISKKLKEILEKEWLAVEWKDIQFLPIQVQEKWNPSNRIEDYYVCNILNFVEWVLDKEKSKMWCFTYREVVFKKEIEKYPYHIFRIKENDITFYISEKVKEVLDRSDLKIDLRFTEIEVG